MTQIARTVTAFLASRRFLVAVFIFFAFESAWVALSSAYPMAFDEDYHFGLIRVYADHWLPFLSSQPPDANQFGAVARDTSFLYHWLMSVPYRLVVAVTSSQTAQIIALRFINIAIFGISLWLYVGALRRMGMSRMFTHTALALFVLIPIVPLLAGQINYDSLFMVFVSGITLLTFTLIEQLRAGRLRPVTLVVFVAVCMLGSLTKYAFLPIALTAVIILGVTLWRTHRTRLAQLIRHVKEDSWRLPRAMQLGLVVLLVVSSVLFVQRYVVNLAQYHTPVPDCAMVLDEDACKAYGPWARNYRMASEKTAVNANPIGYTWTWLLGLHYRLFFMVNGPHHDYASYPMVPLPSAAFIVLAISGFIALLLYWRALGLSPYIVVGLVISCTYVGVLWINNYTDYLQTGWPVAVNGRYLLPVLLLLAAPWGKALARALRPWPFAMPLAAAVTIVLFLQGGGVGSFILRTDPTWYWPNQTIVTHANNAARTVLDPIIFEGPKYY
ncbi:MAG TPA: hypothetical protein VLE73_01555 [Candidatus Saccharimonadales bacterium]|nr:hypothetical protein [Candidatus Saccharimonadales bacterium]